MNHTPVAECIFQLHATPRNSAHARKWGSAAQPKREKKIIKDFYFLLSKVYMYIVSISTAD